MPDPRAPTEPTPPRVSIVVVAAGRGTRMGADRNKVLLDLDDRPVLAHTLDALARGADELVLVTRPEERTEIDAAARRAARPLPPLVWADGGAERADSVRNGVEASAAARDGGVVLVHDAARPFVTDALVAALVDAAVAHGAAVPALPVVDTLKRTAADAVVETVDRTGLARAQTPQAFRVDVLRAALSAPTAAGATDDASAVERNGGTVSLVPGDAWNLKITTPEDLAFARALLPSFLARRAQESPT